MKATGIYRVSKVVEDDGAFGYVAPECEVAAYSFLTRAEAKSIMRHWWGEINRRRDPYTVVHCDQIVFDDDCVWLADEGLYWANLEAEHQFWC